MKFTFLNNSNQIVCNTVTQALFQIHIGNFDRLIINSDKGRWVCRKINLNEFNQIVSNL